MCRSMPISSISYYVRYRWQVRSRRRVEHYRGLHFGGKKFSVSTGATLTRTAFWREKIFWLNGRNTDEGCILTGKDFLAKRVQHWRGLHFDRKRFFGQRDGTLTRIAFWREKIFWLNGRNTDEDFILTGKDFLTKRVDHWRGSHFDGKRFSG